MVMNCIDDDPAGPGSTGVDPRPARTTSDWEDAMKFLCLAYGDDAKWNALTPAERDVLDRECARRDDALVRTGHVLAMHALSPDRIATLRPRHGAVSITDGPYVEMKEHLGGFFLIEARDMAEAIQLMSQSPPARLGEHLGWRLEVRPIDEPTHG
jgi:hypothetical protein